MPDLRPLAPDPELAHYARVAEAGYRRGYSQGFVAAVDAVARGAKLPELAEHEHELMFWRYQERPGEFVIPPILRLPLNANPEPLEA